MSEVLARIAAEILFFSGEQRRSRRSPEKKRLQCKAGGVFKRGENLVAPYLILHFSQFRNGGSYQKRY